MNPFEIVKRWDAVAPCFSNHPRCWIQLLRIACTGTLGITVPEFNRQLSPNESALNRKTLSKWEKHGLVRMERQSFGNSISVRYFITEKGASLLRVKIPSTPEELAPPPPMNRPLQAMPKPRLMLPSDPTAKRKALKALGHIC